MMTQSNASCQCSRYNTPNGITVSTKMNKAYKATKKGKKDSLREYCLAEKRPDVSPFKVYILKITDGLLVNKNM